MIPNASDFNSTEGNGVWFWWKDPEKRVWVYQTNWPKIVRAVQETLKAVFTGWDDTSKFDQPCQPNPAPSGWYNPRNIEVDGVWGDLTARYFALFLCQTGNVQASQTAAQEYLANRIGEGTMRFVLWVAFFVSPGGVQLDRAGQRVDEEARENGKGIMLAANSVMPKFGIRPAVAATDANWWANDVAGGPIQTPPSMGSKPLPWPAGLQIPAALMEPGMTQVGTAGGQVPMQQAAASSNSIMPFLILGSLGVGAYFLLNDKEGR